MFVFGNKIIWYFVVVVYNRLEQLTSVKTAEYQTYVVFLQNLTASYDFLEDRNISIDHKPGRYVITFWA